LLNLAPVISVYVEDGFFHLPDYRRIGIRGEAPQRPRAHAHLAQREFLPVQLAGQPQQSAVALSAHLRHDVSRLLENLARDQGLSLLEARKELRPISLPKNWNHSNAFLNVPRKSFISEC